MKIHVGTNYEEKRVKAVIDVDCLPTDLHMVHIFTSSADENNPADVSERFWNVYDALRFVETAMGYEVCIDFGSRFYETGMSSPTNYVGV